jgi:uncharacterized protein (DUF1330 family)
VRRYGGRYLGVSKSPPNVIELVEEVMSPPDVLSIITFLPAEAAKALLQEPGYTLYRATRHARTQSSFCVFDKNTRPS